MVEDVAGADRLAAVGFLLNIVDFADFHRLDPAILGQTGRSRGEFTPIVRCASLDRDFGSRDDEIRLAEGPLVVIGESASRRQIGRVAFGRAVIGPFGHLREFFIRQRDVVFIVLDTDVFFGVPGRHHAAFVAQRCPFLDGLGPRTHLTICDEGHRREAVLVVAVLTTPLQDGGDILRERGDCAIGFGRHGGSSADQASKGEAKHNSGHGQIYLLRADSTRSSATPSIIFPLRPGVSRYS